MVSVQPPPAAQPRRRELPYARVLLPPAILMAAATGAAAALVTGPARAAVGWCGAVATVLVIATAAQVVRRGRELRAAREEHARATAYLERRVAVHELEMERLAREIMPAAIDYLHCGNSPREVIRDLGDLDPSYRELTAPQLKMIERVLQIIDHEEALRDSAQRSFVSIARRVQAIVHQQNNELLEMEYDHGNNPDVFDDLLRLDHGTALIGRLADSISVLGGGRPGRQWPKPVVMYSVLRGAMSRILQYRRIKLENIAKVNIRGISVEPVIHAVAELLDNATRYSPPESKVHVTATEVQTGVAIEIEDAGVSLSEEARAKVEGMLEDAKRGVDIQDLGTTPRLGLAVVGRLCTAFDMQVSLRTSAYGGVRAVLVIPREMITSDPGVGLAHGIGVSGTPMPELGAVPGPERKPKTRRPTNPKLPAGVSMEDDVPIVTEWTANGLPQRRSRVKTPLSERIAAQAAAEREDAERIARGEKPLWGDAIKPKPATPDPEPAKKDDTPPGMWVEAFWEGLKRDPDPNAFPNAYRTDKPTDEPARASADDEGDLK